MEKNYNDLIFRIKEGITSIQDQINLTKKDKFKNLCIKNLKISKKMLNFFTPVIITAFTIPLIGYFSGKGLPFYKDIFKKTYNENPSFFDNYQNQGINNIIIVHNWIQSSELTYDKISKYYTIDYDKITEQDIIDILNGKVSVTTILGNPIKETRQKESIVNQNDTYIQAYFVDENGENIVLEKETTSNNDNVSLMELTIIIVLSVILLNIRKYDINSEINGIKEEYNKKTNLKTLRKQLTIRIQNYFRLTGRGYNL